MYSLDDLVPRLFISMALLALASPYFSRLSYSQRDLQACASKRTGKGVAAGFDEVYYSSIGKQYSSDEIQLAVRLFRVDEVGMKSLNGARLSSMLL